VLLLQGVQELILNIGCSCWILTERLLLFVELLSPLLCFEDLLIRVLDGIIIGIAWTCGRWLADGGLGGHLFLYSL